MTATHDTLSPESETAAVASAAPVQTRASRLRDFWSDFCRAPVAVLSLVVILVLAFVSFGAPLVSPQDPYDMAALDWMDAFLRPGTVGSGATPIGWGPTMRAAICCRRSSTGCARRLSSASARARWRCWWASASACRRPTLADGWKAC